MKSRLKITPVLMLLAVGLGQAQDSDQASQAELKKGAQSYAATYFGGNAADSPWNIALDKAGNVFVTGSTTSPDFMAAANSSFIARRGKSDVFILKFDKDLRSVLASARIGGSEDECAYAILHDKRGFVYVAGYTGSKDFPTTPSAYSPKYNGGEGDAFVLKMDDNLTKIAASTLLGGSGTEDDFRSPEIVQDEKGRIYIAGITQSTDFPVTQGAFQEKQAGGKWDVFLSKFDPDLKNLLASTYLGGDTEDRMGRGLAVDPVSGDVCLAGFTYSSIFPVAKNAYSRYIGGGPDGFIMKFTPDLSKMTASTMFAGWIYSMFIHETGDIYVGGHAGTRLPITSQAYHRAFDKQNEQGFISSLSNDLTRLKSSTVLPGSLLQGLGETICLDLAQSPDGQIVAAGWVRAKDFPTTPGAFDETANGEPDCFVLKMSPDLSTLLASTFVGGGKRERWNRMTTGRTGRIYLVTQTASADFPATPGTASPAFRGGANDGALVRFGPSLSSDKHEEFHQAAEKDRVEELKRLLSGNGALIEKTDRYQRTALHGASRYGALEAAGYLLDHGADVTAVDESGNTPLHLAAMYGHAEISERLIAQKAVVDALNKEGVTPLYLAAYYGDPRTVGLLLSRNADPDLRDRDGLTPLHVAALSGEGADKVREMLKFDPEIEAKNKAGQTPLHMAAGKHENQEVIGLLLDRGAALEAVDGEGKTVLMSSASSNWKCLVERGADVHFQDRDGNTALHLAMQMALRFKPIPPHVIAVIKVLAAAGADPDLKNKGGKSPLDIAREIGDPSLIALITSRK